VNRYNPNTKPNPAVNVILNKAVKEIGDDIDGLNFNTGVSGLMKLLNIIESHELAKKDYEILLKLLAPFAPHISEELWQNVLKNKKSIHLERWPDFDPKLSAGEKIKIVIQVNGKMRDIIEIEPAVEEKEIKEIALAMESIKRHIGPEPVKKIIYIKGRVLNIVI
jgi:leucyl-tRNA synthetase